MNANNPWHAPLEVENTTQPMMLEMLFGGGTNYISFSKYVKCIYYILMNIFPLLLYTVCTLSKHVPILHNFL